MDSPSRAAIPPLDPRVWRIACVVLLGPLMTALDSTVVNVSLARLGQDLGVPLTTIQWVTSGYLLALALMLPLCGWLVDRIGAKRVYLASFTAFTLASMLCGWAGSARTLIGFRILQGMAGGLLVPMAQLVTAREAGPHVARVMGYMVMPVLLGAIGGPVLAGFILQHASWRWIFFLNLPVGLLATTLAAWLLPGDQAETRPRPFDLAGFALLSPALVLLLHSLERLSVGRGGPAPAWRNWRRPWGCWRGSWATPGAWAGRPWSSWTCSAPAASTPPPRPSSWPTPWPTARRCCCPCTCSRCAGRPRPRWGSC